VEELVRVQRHRGALRQVREKRACVFPADGHDWMVAAGSDSARSAPHTRSIRRAAVRSRAPDEVVETVMEVRATGARHPSCSAKRHTGRLWTTCGRIMRHLSLPGL
jgi:hypothetical protein